MKKFLLIIALVFLFSSVIIAVDSQYSIWSDSSCSINCENGNASTSCPEGQTCTCKCTQQGDPICWCEEN